MAAPYTSGLHTDEGVRAESRAAINVPTHAQALPTDEIIPCLLLPSAAAATITTAAAATDAIHVPASPVARAAPQEDLCMTSSQAGREARKLRNKSLDTKITARYPLYAEIAERERVLLGLRGGTKKGTAFIAAAASEEELPDADDNIPEIAFAG
jgi:hypothetical protein